MNTIKAEEAVITTSGTVTVDPGLGALGDNSATNGVQTMALGASSSALNIGAFVRKQGTTFYYSSDGNNWYTGFDRNGLTTATTLPADTENLTATDARDFARGTGTLGRPDAGAYEYDATTP
jgi:hypothetical protein